jgi:alpha-ketoglutarate-dependent taurine dioxygenase
MLTFRLAPGDCVVFDNTRILHARTGFASTGAGICRAGTPISAVSSRRWP